jgi:PH domain
MSTKAGKPLISGYLLKFTKGSSDGDNWKRRFFVLRDSTLAYYTDHQSKTPRDSLILFGETELARTAFAGQRFCITLRYPFDLVYFGCEDEQSLLVWMNALQKTIEAGKATPRGYMNRCIDSREGRKMKRRFFVLHRDAVTVHQDKENLHILQGIYRITQASVMEYDDAHLILVIIDHSVEGSQRVTIAFQEDFGRDVGVYQDWKREINTRLVKAGGTVQPFVGTEAEKSGDLSCYFCFANMLDMWKA